LCCDSVGANYGTVALWWVTSVLLNKRQRWSRVSDPPYRNIPIDQRKPPNRNTTMLAS